MTTPADTAPLRDDLQLERFLAPLLDVAIRRQSWFFFLDDESVPIGPVMPCDEHPRSPLALSPTEDLGVLPWAEVVAHRFAGIMREFDFAQLVIVWERPGGAELRDDDLAWARTFADAFRANGARVRAQFLLHDGGLRVFAADDLLP